MKKFLLTMASGAMVLSAFTTPIFAASTDETVKIGYTEGSIPNPDKPTDPDWTVKIPKGFNFTKTVTKNALDVELDEIAGKPLFAADKKVQVDIASANAFTLKNGNNAVKSSLVYKLTYGGNSIVANGMIGELTADAKIITGTAELTEDLANIDIGGTYQDTLTYTIHSAINK